MLAADPADTWDLRLERGDRNAFDAVRLFLATLVVLEHSYFLIDNSSARDPLSILSHGQTNCGQFAVFMFFSLSGFLVTFSLTQSATVAQFVGKRIARIVPGFLVASAVGFLVVGPLTSSHLAGYFRAQNWPAIIVEALALKQVAVSGVLAGNPLRLVHGTLWTIQYEFDCYLLLALLGALTLLRPNLRFATFGCLGALLTAAMIFPMPVVDHGVPALLISSPSEWGGLFPFFFVGSAFFLYRERIPKSRFVFIACLAVIAFTFAFRGAYWALLLCGTYAMLYVSLSCAAELKLLGRRIDLSYGVYLYGWPIQQMLLFYSGMKLPALPLFAASLVLSCLTAWASWTIVERPSLGLVRHSAK